MNDRGNETVPDQHSDGETALSRRWIDKAEELVSIAVLLILVLTVLTQVVSRYVFSNSLPWTEELARYQLVVLVFLGSSIAVRKRGHVALDFILTRLPAGVRFYVKRFNDLVELFFYSFSVWVSWQMMTFSWSRYMVSVQISRGFIYLCVLIGFGLMAFRSIEHIIVGFSGRKTAGTETETLE